MKLELKAGKMVRETQRSAGFDLFSHEPGRILIRPGEFRAIDVGVVTEFEEGYAALIWDKSGYALKNGITIIGGLIDGDYPDTWKAILLNIGKEPFILDPGQKVTQVIFVRLAEVQDPGPDSTTLVHVGATFITNSKPRVGGFGSTG